MRLFHLASIMLATTLVLSINAGNAASPVATPRLVVIVTLDQFPYDYLARYQQFYGQGGFRYLLDGAVFTNASYKHANTSTGPGHAVILSGTYARTNGISRNSWYDRNLGRSMYCVEDRSVEILGAKAEGRSPVNYKTYTYGDMLRIGTAFKAKSIAISNKDRAAILPGGKLANIALWQVDSAFVSSTYYVKELPPWVKKFNASGMVNSFFGKTWERTLPPAAFALVDRDDAPYEGFPAGQGRTFPHPIVGDSASHITSSYYGSLLGSPYGAEVLAALAREAVIGEQLGTRGVTDMLSVSFSSPDYVGHEYGPNSQEMLEMNVQMDRILADFFRFLDKQVGLSQCVIVLTADHGVSTIPAYVSHTIGRAIFQKLDGKAIRARAESLLTARFGTPGSGKWVESLSAGSLFIAPAALAHAGVTAEVAAGVVCDDMRRRPEVVAAFTRGQILALTDGSRLEQRLRNSFNDERSGDAIIVYSPFYKDNPDEHGASHGDPIESDAHVPVIFRGPGIRPGTYDADASPADIAPTLSALTGVEFTPLREGRVLLEALNRSAGPAKVRR
ncbi:MAG: alkaline phosphatase family protein [Ignavibacteriae bacterium]|nr:alkaline phosphatase family protein [Ignavibacteriota bacterium]